MNQMKLMQKKFKEKNSLDLASIETESSSNLSLLTSNTSTKLFVNFSFFKYFLIPYFFRLNQNVSCFDQKLQIKAAENIEDKDICILCQDNKEITMVLAAYVQVSNVLSKDRNRQEKFKVRPLVDMTNPNGQYDNHEIFY